MGILVKCKNCRKEIKIGPSRSKAKNICCSYKCSSEFRKKQYNMECAICKKPIKIKPYKVKISKTKEFCCSYKCSGLYKKYHFSGKNNHQFGLKGSLNSSFISDYKITKHGYVKIRNIHHPHADPQGLVFAHRLIMEEYIKNNNLNSTYLSKVDGFGDELFLDTNFIVHHINENKLDNTIENLKIMSKSEHTHHHNISNPVDTDNITGRFIGKKGKKISKQKNNLIKKQYKDAGLDIKSNENCTVKSRSSLLISTGLKIALPNEHVGLIWSRSGLSVKNKIEVGAGCIDENFRGEIKVHLYNLGDVDFEIKIGDRIAQLLTIPINLNEYEEVDELSDTDRGDGGFGSSGV